MAFADSIFECTEVLFRDLVHDTADPEVYEKDAVIAMLQNMHYLVLCSSYLVSELTLLKKVKLMNYSRDWATNEYDKRMDEGYEGDDDND
jgi:hypothetical protein